jgi:hypothetical protein
LRNPLPPLDCPLSSWPARLVWSVCAAAAVAGCALTALAAHGMQRWIALAAGGACLAAAAWRWRHPQPWRRIRWRADGGIEVVDFDGRERPARWRAFARLGPLCWLALQADKHRPAVCWIADAALAQAWSLRWHTLRVPKNGAA